MYIYQQYTCNIYRPVLSIYVCQRISKLRQRRSENFVSSSYMQILTCAVLLGFPAACLPSPRPQPLSLPVVYVSTCLLSYCSCSCATATNNIDYYCCTIYSSIYEYTKYVYVCYQNYACFCFCLFCRSYCLVRSLLNLLLFLLYSLFIYSLWIVYRNNNNFPTATRQTDAGFRGVKCYCLLVCLLPERQARSVNKKEGGRLRLTALLYCTSGGSSSSSSRDKE